MLRHATLILLASALLSAAQAAPTDPQRLAKFGPWSAYTYTENGGKFCYVAGQPRDRKGNVPKRGEAYVLITHRVAAGAFGELSLVPGYAFKEKTEPSLVIGKETFPFYVGKETAWAKDKADARILKAMGSGKEMTISGIAANGARTTDTYALTGFDKALREIDKTCPKKK